MKKFYFLLVPLLLILPVFYVQAQSVDILWQGETYVPPFYEGRSLWSTQSKITLVAIPQGLGNPANLIYKWTKNGTVLGNINGVGRDFLSFLDPIISRPQVIKVEILSSKELVLAGTTIRVVPLSPSLIVYENNPLYGFMFQKAVTGAYKLQDKEITFAGFPFFFSALTRSDAGLRYRWKTNVSGVETGSSATYRAPEDTSGSSGISVTISNEGKITQNGEEKFIIQFEK